MVTKAYALLVLLLLAQGVRAQNIESSQNELDGLKKQIGKLESDLRAIKSKEKKTFEQLEGYSKKTYLLNRLISSLRTEEQEKASQISLCEEQLTALRIRLNFLRSYYASYITGVYKKLNTGKLSFLTDASSLNQAFIRLHYLKTFTERGSGDVRRILAAQSELDSLKGNLEIQKAEKSEVIQQKTKEEKALTQSLKEQKQLLDKIKKDKTALGRELSAKKEAEQQIRRMITRLIAKAKLRAKSRKHKDTAKHSSTAASKAIEENEDFSPAASAKAAKYKGSLHPPVKNGIIVHHAGQTRNEKLNTVTINYGVDIKAGGDRTVRCALDGEISAIDWLPGYGTVVIVTHPSQLRTVYGRLGTINVKEGEKVSSGSPLGSVNESLEGPLLHFEVWNNRVYQNPEQWLRR